MCEMQRQMLVAVGADDRLGLVGLQVGHQRRGGRVVLALGQQHRVLADRAVQVAPARSRPSRCLILPSFIHLRQRDEAQFGVAGGDELKVWAMFSPCTSLGSSAASRPSLVMRLDRGRAVGRELGGGDGDAC